MQYSPELPEALRNRLSNPLPGLDAQMLMAPSIRGRKVRIPPTARQSAVLVLLYPHEGHWYIPFMRRSQDGRVHGGQISFPGGRREPMDVDFTATALREADEEMGIKAHEVEVIGALTELYIPPSNSIVYPRLAVTDKRPDFVPDPVEVAEIIEVQVDQFLDENRKGQHRVDIHKGTYIEAPGFIVNDKELIWGATAMMMAEVIHLIEEAVQ